MTTEKDPKTGKWLIQYRYKDWTGKNRKSTKRGFKTKREAEEWYRDFIMKQSQSCDMKFKDFVELYLEDARHHLCQHTMINKEYIIRDKILPYFAEKRINDITAADVRVWQNSLIAKGYKPTYLKTINNNLSTIFNYAVRYYDMKENPCPPPIRKKAAHPASGCAAFFMRFTFWCSPAGGRGCPHTSPGPP